MDEHWWSIEIFDAERTGYLTADRWRDVFSTALIEAAVTNGAFDWSWQRTDWGVVFEVALREYDAWSVFRNLPVVRAALDAAPDPVNGVVIYSGRGGGAGARVPRTPKPITGAGAAQLPELSDPVMITEMVAERVLQHRVA
jgi:hypothetical protein